MTKGNRLRFGEIILLIVLWTVLIVSPILFRQQEAIVWQDFFRPLETMVPLFVVFLINRLLFVPRLLFRKKQLLYLISVASLIGIFTLGSYTLFDKQQQRRPARDIDDQRWHPPPPHPNGRIDSKRPLPPERRKGGPMPPYANFLIFSVLVVGFDTGLRLSVKWFESEQKRMNAEKENAESQLAFLRNQVSPHFFMNTLNNIHSLIDIEKEEAKETIIRLSKLMRHLLYDSEVEEIAIQKEIEFVRNYVDLMRLRYSEKVNINLDIQPDIPEKTIPPLLFTSFVENAFKHGISYQHDSYIFITFSHQNNKLLFRIENSNYKNEIDEGPSGIGIENARKRLDLLYGNLYSLKIEEKKLVYIVNLSIPL